MHSLNMHGQAQRLPQISHVRLVLLRFLAAKAVIDMRDMEVEPRQDPPLPQLVQDQDETHGVGSAGDGHEYAVVGTEQLLLPNRCHDLPENRMRSSVAPESHRLHLHDDGRAGTPATPRRMSRVRATSAEICRARPSADSNA